MILKPKKVKSWNLKNTTFLDTNILLEDATNIFKLSDESKNLIILAETVLDEIDSKRVVLMRLIFKLESLQEYLKIQRLLNQ